VRISILIVLLFAVTSCGTLELCGTESNLVAVTNEYEEANSIDSLIFPYRDSLEAEMKEVIATSEEDMVKGRPNAVLNNWAADAVQSTFANKIDGPVFTLLNVGGLRNPISKGEITVGDIFKLMPFDNMVVCVEMPIETLSEIERYLVTSGGEPISGITVDKGEIVFNGEGGHSSSYWVLTSDYLMNGGDKMSFFEKRISVVETNELLRDTFMQVANEQGALAYPDDIRIIVEE
jgi:2',3'-cyclic-nucleotide 2'-phosphodiesterase (5'-nucleotidase family)